MIKIAMVNYKILLNQQKNSRTGDSRATSLPPIGNSFMYIKTLSINHGNIVFVSFERTDTIQITNLTF